MADIGLVQIISYRDPAFADSGEDMGIQEWVAQTAYPLPCLKTDTKGSSPSFSVEMRVLKAEGYSRKDALEKLRREISYELGRIPELQCSEIEVS